MLNEGYIRLGKYRLLYGMSWKTFWMLNEGYDWVNIDYSMVNTCLWVVMML